MWQHLLREIAVEKKQPTEINLSNKIILFWQKNKNK